MSQHSEESVFEASNEAVSPLPAFALAPRPVQQQPAAVYIQSLSAGSQRTMKGALFTLVQLLLPDVHLTPEAIYAFPWELLRYEHASVLRARVAERYSPATANKLIAALRGVLRAAWQLELMPAEAYHKAASIVNVRGSTLPAGRSLRDGELRALLTACRSDSTLKGCRDLALIALLFATGLRRQEVTLLDVEHYERETHALQVHGKGQKERLVYVEAPGAYEALHAWIAQRGPAPGPLFVRIRRGGHLVTTQGQLQRLSEQAVYSIVLERAEESGILALSTHDFRRNFIGELLDNQVDLSTVQKLAGHASPTTTARYDRRPEATKKRAAGTLHVPMIGWQPPDLP